MDIDVNAAEPSVDGRDNYSDRLMVPPRCDSASAGGGGGGTSFSRRRKLSTAGKVR